MLDILIYFGIVAPIWVMMQLVAVLAQSPFYFFCALVLVLLGALASVPDQPNV